MKKPLKHPAATGRALLLASLASLAACYVQAATLTGADVGAPSNPGSLVTTNNASGKPVHVVTGGGSDIWGTSDNFFYAYFPVTGDFDYVVRVQQLIGNSGDGGWSKAELMARLDDGSGVPSGGDPFIANMVNRPSSDTANGAPAGVNNRGPQWRANRDGNATWTTPNPAFPPNTTGNNWIRLERVGSTFYMYTSDDGKAWNMYNPFSPQGWDTADSWPPGADNPGEAFFTNAWPAKILLGLAVTAHNDADVSVGVFADFGPYTPTAPQITTQPPATLSISANSVLQLSVAATGDPVHYQWYKDNTPIARAVLPTYKVDLAKTTDSGTYKCKVFGGGTEIMSSETAVTVTIDNTAPTIVSATGSADFTTVTVKFSEPVDKATGEAKANYTLSGGVTITSATQSASADTVILVTSQQPQGQTLTLTVSNVKDTAGNVIAANSSAQLKTFVFANGWASYSRWHNENGVDMSLADFVNAVNDGTIRPPDYNSANTQLGGPWGVRDNYSARVFTWFVPPTSGNYVFFLSSDDGSNLYLSTDDKPANKKLIAQETGWSNQYQWYTVGGGSTVEDKRSDSFGASEWASWPTITLTAGQKYYMEILFDEGGGGDGADATFIKEGDPDPAQSAAGMLLKGSVIGTFLDPAGAVIDITQQPASTTQQEQRAAVFTVAATITSPYASAPSYQWQKAAPGSTTFTDIAGATSASYTTPILTLADNGAKYRCNLSIPTLTQASAEATLTVVADTFAPQVAGAGAIWRNNAVEIGVGFDENVDAVTAGTAANYTLSKGTVTGVRYQKFAHTGGSAFFVLGSAGPFAGAAVVLTTTGLAAGDDVTVTVKNIKDIKGNTMAAAGESKMLKVTSKMKWAAMGGNEIVEGATFDPEPNRDPSLWPDDVIAYGESDFDVVSSGTANWNAYDEATFIYEEVTGDFDKVVRVEYHDPTSQWARAGLCATPSADEGITRAQAESDAGPKMERRFMQRVNPAVQWNGNAGNNQHEVNWRLTKGGTYGGAGGGTPAYPNAWLRMQRIGQTFNGLYSMDNGKTWVQYGTQTFTDEPMPATLLVGPYYCPEFGNNNSAGNIGHSTVGKFRQYGSFVANPSQVTYGIGLNFGADEPNAANGGILPSIATAGAPGVLQGNWNNLSGSTGTAAAGIMADKLGSSAPTAVNVDWTSPNTWSSTGRGEENNALPANDKILMTGYLDTGAATTTIVNISGLPADLTTPGYDVYVYALGGVSGRGGGYRITKADGTTALTEWVDMQSPAMPTAHVKAVPVAGQWVPATYAVFKNLKDAAIQVQASTEGGHAFGGTPRASLNAIQIVPTGGAEELGDVSISLSGGTVTITWEGDGTLMGADVITGPWTAIGSTKPYTTPATGAAKYFRVQGN